MKNLHIGGRTGIRVWAAVVLAAALPAAVFLGCALGLPGGGGSIEMSFAPGAKAGDAGTVYAYLYRGNRLFRGPFTGGLEEPEDQVFRGTVRIDGIPPGSDYRLVILRKKNGGPSYDVAFPQDPISVRAGAESVVRVDEGDFRDVTLEFFSFMDGNSPMESPHVTSVAALNDGSVFAVSGESLFGIEPVYQLAKIDAKDQSGNSVSLPPINSLSVGTDATGNHVYLNTREGSFGYIQSDIFTSIYNPLGTNEVKKSASGSGSAPYDNCYVVKTPQSLVAWLSGYPTTIDLGLGRNIKDMVVYTPGAGQGWPSVWIATDSAGAFVLDRDVFPDNASEPINLSFDELRGESWYHHFSENEHWGSSMPRILSFGLDNSGSSPGLYIGTSSGLFKADTIDATGLGSDAILLEGTAGLGIEKIVVVDLNQSNSGVACMTSSGVILYNSQYDEVVRLPFLNLWVGEVTDIGLIVNDFNNTLLYVAGTKGLLEMNVSSWLP